MQAKRTAYKLNKIYQSTLQVTLSNSKTVNLYFNTVQLAQLIRQLIVARKVATNDSIQRIYKTPIVALFYLVTELVDIVKFSVTLFPVCLQNKCLLYFHVWSG